MSGGYEGPTFAEADCRLLHRPSPPTIAYQPRGLTCAIARRLQTRVSLRPLFGEHLLQALQNFCQRVGTDLAEAPDQSLLINGPELIEGNETRTLLKSTADSPRICVPAGRHRCHDDGSQMFIQFVGRHHHARPSFLDFTAKRRVEPNEMNVAAPHHQRHSRASNLVDVGSSSKPSSPRERIDFAAAAHPARGRRRPLTTRRPGSARTSTSSDNCARSNRSFGTRMPREFPI